MGGGVDGGPGPSVSCVPHPERGGPAASKPRHNGAWSCRDRGLRRSALRRAPCISRYPPVRARLPLPLSWRDRRGVRTAAGSEPRCHSHGKRANRLARPVPIQPAASPRGPRSAVSPPPAHPPPVGATRWQRGGGRLHIGRNGGSSSIVENKTRCVCTVHTYIRARRWHARCPSGPAPRRATVDPPPAHPPPVGATRCRRGGGVESSLRGRVGHPPSWTMHHNDGGESGRRGGG